MSFDFKFGRRSYIPPRFLEIKPKPNYVRLYNGCRVHLHSKNGTYTVLSYTHLHAKITCQVWRNHKSWGIRQEDYKIIPRSDIKCLYDHGRG